MTIFSERESPIEEQTLLDGDNYMENYMETASDIEGLISMVSSLTDPTAIGRFESAVGDALSDHYANVSITMPLITEESLTLENEHTGTDDNEGTVGQFSDLNSQYMVAVANRIRAFFYAAVFPRGGMKLPIATLLVFLVVGIPAIFMYGSMHGRDRQHKSSPGQSTNRTEQVLQCALKLSGSDSIRGNSNATNYFLQGSGRRIDPKHCLEDDSLFSTVYSLIVIRESLKVANPSWHYSGDITSIADICRWKRVHCGKIADKEELSVTELIFNNAKLSGSIPSEIQWLKSLQVLHLYTNPEVTGTIPSELGMLTNLQQLEIHWTSLQGTVPKTLGHLSFLNEFLLYDTNVTGSVPDDICTLRDTGHLSRLDATCAGVSPGVQCACCTHCHHEQVSSPTSNSNAQS